MMERNRSPLLILLAACVLGICLLAHLPTLFSSEKFQSSLHRLFLPKNVSLQNTFNEITPEKETKFLRSRLNASRVFHAKSLSPAKDPLPWSTVLVTLASLFGFISCPRWLPLHYLHTASHRLLGWHDANLQFRFIHSR